jgi:GTPase
MDRLIRTQVLVAIEEADVLVLLVDGKAGPHPLDYAVAEHLRRRRSRWCWPSTRSTTWARPRPPRTTTSGTWGSASRSRSALSGKGSGDVLDQMLWATSRSGEEEVEEALRVAVIGRPNVGKSSFVNRLLGEERLVVSDVAGTTRDAIDTPMRYKGRTLVFVDTAGLRRQSEDRRGGGVLQLAPHRAGHRARGRVRCS